MAQPQSPSFLLHFAALEDPRVERTRQHRLLDIVFIAVCAVVSGANGFVGMEKFGKAKRDWLAKYLDLPGGIPAHDTFGRVLSALKPAGFLDCFLSWVESLRISTAGKVIGIDGKTARASLDRAGGKSPLHVVSAWAADNRLVLGQVTTDAKSNEITAIPELLRLLELHGAIVTIDAMGCQKGIVAQVRAQGGDYVVAVKGNQEHLEEDVVHRFVQLDEGQFPQADLSVYETDEKGHGRRDYRRYEAAPVPQGLRHLQEWKDLQSIARVTRVYQERGVEKSEVRYFISSLPASAERLAGAIRGHWGIENGLHWVLDMYFGEDRSRARVDYAAENMALLRRWVLSLLRQDTTLKGGIETKRLQVAWDEKNLEKLLGL